MKPDRMEVDVFDDGDVVASWEYTYRWAVRATRYWWDETGAPHSDSRRFFGPGARERAVAWTLEAA